MTGRRALPLMVPALASILGGCGSSSKSTTTTPASTAAVPAAAATTTAAAASSAAGTRTVTGSVVSDRFGDNQVTLVLKGKKITDVRYTLPTDRPRSVEINNQAGPLLRAEVLQAQSASINTISGATYTSEAFAQSLQAAVNSAGL